MYPYITHLEKKFCKTLSGVHSAIENNFEFYKTKPRNWYPGKNTRYYKLFENSQSDWICWIRIGFEGICKKNIRWKKSLMLILMNY